MTCPETDSDAPNRWYIGAVINVIGSIGINLGTNVIKLGHNKRAALDMPEEDKPRVTRFKEWQIGMVIFVIGNVANFVSFGFAAQSLLAALGSVQFVSNVIFAAFVLKEKVTIIIIVSTALIVGGCLMLVLFGNHCSVTYTVDELLHLYTERVYVAYMIMEAVLFFGCYILYMHGKKVVSEKGAANATFWFKLLPVSYSVFSALLGTQSVLFSKTLSTLLRTTFQGDNQLDQWFTWVVLVLFILAAIFWITRLNKGLRLFPSMIIVPTMQICWTLFSILSGMLYFEEYETFTTLSAVMFSVGVLIVFIGVALLTQGAAAKIEGYQKVSDEEADEKKAKETEVYDNKLYEPTPEHDIPDKRLNLDTLRFTSLATTIKTTDHTGQHKQSLKPKPDFPSDGDPEHGEIRSEEQPPVISTNEDLEDHAKEKHTFKDSLKTTLKTWKKRLNTEVQVFGKDAVSAAKLTVGYGGKDERMPAVSLFGMPAVEIFNTSRVKKKPSPGPTTNNTLRTPVPENVQLSEFALLSALPGSRFSEHADRQSPSEPQPSAAGPSKGKGGQSKYYVPEQALNSYEGSGEVDQALLAHVTRDLVYEGSALPSAPQGLEPARPDAHSGESSPASGTTGSVQKAAKSLVQLVSGPGNVFKAQPYDTLE